MVVARLGAAMPSVGGEEWLLPSFLGPVLGGTLLSGGVVAVVGTMIGAALVTTIRSGLLVLQIGNFWLQLFLGLILLFAVLVDRYRGRLCRAPHAEAALTRCFAACSSSNGRASWSRSSSAAPCSPCSPRISSPSSTSTSCSAASASALLVGFAQMVTLGVGQMNIAVGALGGLVAISLGGMLEVMGVPLDPRRADRPR